MAHSCVSSNYLIIVLLMNIYHWGFVIGVSVENNFYEVREREKLASAQEII